MSYTDKQAEYAWKMCAKFSKRAHKHKENFNQWCLEKYGVSISDIDCDSLIDDEYIPSERSIEEIKHIIEEDIKFNERRK